LTAPITEGLTPHSLRHTYISLRVALGDDPAVISQDAGHADMAVTLRIYTHVMRLQEGDRERLKALVNGGEPIDPKPPRLRGFRRVAGGRLELPTSRL